MVALIISGTILVLLLIGLSILTRYYLKNRSKITWKKIERQQQKYLEDKKHSHEVIKRQWDRYFNDYS